LDLEAEVHNEEEETDEEELGEFLVRIGTLAYGNCM